MNQDNKGLTEIEDWDKVWRTHKLPQVFKTKYNHYYVDVLDRFFHKYLPVNKNLDSIELGCVPGRWLHYFHEDFGYSVAGLDNSALGVEMTKKNLQLLGVVGEVYRGDVRNFIPPRKFDMVSSFGLIEHFEDTTDVVKKHLEYLKPGGLLVILVPNFFTPFYGNLQRWLDPELFAIHKKVTEPDLEEIVRDLQLEKIFVGYVGVFNLSLLGIPEKKKWAHFLVRWIQTITTRIFRFVSVKRETSLFSPYIFVIARKPQ